jgi:hypothetical protein
MHQLANAIADKGFRKKKSAFEAIHIVATPKELLRRLALDCFGEQAPPSVSMVQRVKIAYELR